MISESIISGHAPGPIRAAFVEAVEGLSWNPSSADLATSKVLAGRLWNCTDTLPGSVCADLNIPLGSTYAQGARHLIRL